MGVGVCGRRRGSTASWPRQARAGTLAALEASLAQLMTIMEALGFGDALLRRPPALPCLSCSPWQRWAATPPSRASEVSLEEHHYFSPCGRPSCQDALSRPTPHYFPVSATGYRKSDDHFPMPGCGDRQRGLPGPNKFFRRLVVTSRDVQRCGRLQGCIVAFGTWRVQSLRPGAKRCLHATSRCITRWHSEGKESRGATDAGWMT